MVWQRFDWRRASAALLVVLLHVAFIGIFLRTTWHREVAPSPRELVLRILPLPPPKPAQHAPPIPLIRPDVTVPRETTSPTVTAPPAAALPGLNQSLFGCAPGNLDKLAPEERANCLSHQSRRNVEEPSVLNLPSRAHDEPHWQRALARKQNPTLLPCANPGGLPLTLGSVVCAANGAFNGFGDLDEQPGYGEAPSVAVHVPNNGDPPEEPAHH